MLCLVEKNGYSAASTGTVFIEAQSSVVPKPNSFTVLSTGKIRIKCKTRTPKASLGSDEIVGVSIFMFINTIDN